MIKVNVIKMLHTMHRMGVRVDVRPEWDREEWVNAVIHQFNVHCLPYSHEIANETAQVCYRNRGWLGKAGEWKRPWNAR
jgi:hypothetical protein